MAEAHEDKDQNTAASKESAQAGGNTSKPWYHRHLWQIQPVRDLLLIASIIGLFILGEALSIVTVPMLIALGLAYGAEPFITWLENRVAWLTRTRALVALCTLLVAGLTLAIVLVVPLIFRQASGLIANRVPYATAVHQWAIHQDELPEALADVVADGALWLGAIPESTSLISTEEDDSPSAIHNAAADSATAQAITVENISAYIEAEVRRQMAEQALINSLMVEPESEPGMDRDQIGRAVASVGGVVTRTVTSIFDMGMFAFLVVFFFVVFSLGFAQVSQNLLSFIPSDKRERWMPILREMDGAISGFIRGRLSIAALTGIAYAVGWTFCGVPFAVLIGFAVGVIGIIPYGSVLGLIGAYVLLIIDLVAHNGAPTWYHRVGEQGALMIVWWKVLVFPGAVYMIVQLLDDYVLTPLIQGNATKLNTPAIIAAVIAGGALGGLFGMLLAIPVAACLRILLNTVVIPSLRDWLEGRRADPIPVGSDSQVREGLKID